MPTSRTIATTTRISAPVDSSLVSCGIFDDRLDGRVESVLSVGWFAVVGGALVLVRVFGGMTVE